MEAFKLEYYDEDDYYALPEDRKVELIDGVFYDMATAGVTHHRISRRISFKIEDHINRRSGKCEVFEALDVKPWPDRRDTIVEPDILVVCDPEKITERRIEGAPDFVIEIASPGNYQNDYLRKLEIYSKCGVREYWIINPMKRNVLVYIFENGEIAPAMYTFDDSIPVSIFEGLTIDMREITREKA